MAPETEMEALVAGVCPQSGHWPYTKKAELYIGFRPGGETLSFSSSRVTGTVVSYDIVICAVRGKSAEMEALRYRLYDALHANGWYLDGDPGPETYDRNAGLFYWPVSAKKALRHRRARRAGGPDGEEECTWLSGGQSPRARSVRAPGTDRYWR